MRRRYKLNGQNTPQVTYFQCNDYINVLLTFEYLYCVCVTLALIHTCINFELLIIKQMKVYDFGYLHLKYSP